MPTIYKIDDHIWRGPRPMSPDDYEQLAQQTGINTLLNLEYGWYDWLHDELNFENCFATLNKMTPIHVVMSDIMPPKDIYVDACLRIMQNPQYGNIFVHCKTGKDRTGYVCAAYRVKVQKWTPDAAINEMLSLGFHVFPYIYWLPSLHKYLAAA